MKNIKSKKALTIIISLMIVSINCIIPGITYSHIRIIKEKGLEVRLDLSDQILHLDVLEKGDYPKIYPTIKDTNPYFLSTAIFVAKAKQFDDSLIASLEYLCQDGTREFTGKREILEQTTNALKRLSRETEINEQALLYCRGFINAASNLGGQQIEEIDAVQKIAKEIKLKFLKDDFKSKPISIYTWTEYLSNIFKQDRLLQESLVSEDRILLFARGISENKKLAEAYKKYLLFTKKLTNPFPPDYRDLLHVEDLHDNLKQKIKYSFFPPSQAHETELIKRLFGDTPIPEGFSLIDTLVKKIQKNEIDLTPNNESGWYDYQIFALEPFVKPEFMPEGEKLEFGKKYKEELIELFKASLALTRETHIKLLERPLIGAYVIPEITIEPELSIEPIATYYLRRAESYGFVRKLLETTFGHDVLKKTHRLTISGRVSQPLLEEILNMESLFHGAYQIVAEEIGMNIDSQIKERSEQEKKADKDFTREWFSNLKDDTDVSTDNRMMVPVFYDIARKK
ncbi:hypothetical protein ACFL1N_08330 [Thermodesulfobacteriota bacterium]